LLGEIEFGSLDPCITDAFGEAPRSAEDFEEERANYHGDVTPLGVNVSVRLLFGTDRARSRAVPIPYGDIFLKLKVGSLAVAEALGAGLSPLTRGGASS